MTMLNITINGRAHGPTEVRDELTMNDFLREVLGMTGTKFGCGAAQCLSCAVIIDNPDGTSFTSPTCVVSAASFNFKKRAGHYWVWFDLLIPRETNIKIIQRLSEVPEIIQVETGNGARELAAVLPGETGTGEPRG